MTHPPTRFERRDADWLSYGEALRRVLAAAWAPEAEEVATAAAVGRALVEDVEATATLPPWDNAAMDGYAVRGEDVATASREQPARLQVVDVVHAGRLPGAIVTPGTAVRIMTGAPVPSGADTVVRVEDTDAEVEPGFVRIFDARDRGRNVRPAGQDVQVGDPVLPSGHTVHPGSVGVLAALGRGRVRVGRRPTVAVLSTGDELRTPDRYEDVRRGIGVPESNGPMLCAAVEEAGGTALSLGIAPDDAAGIRASLEGASDADVVVTVGGASMGEADLVKGVLEDLGYRLDFWRVRLRPGTPFSLGYLPGESRSRPVFGLPGNPSSAFVTFELLVRPFLRAVAGHARIHRPRIRCRAGERLGGKPGRAFGLRVRILWQEDGGPTAVLTGPQGSGLVRGLGAADGIALIPEASDGIPPGDPVDVILLPGGAAGVEEPPVV